MINLNEMLQQAYPVTTRSYQVSASKLKSMGDVRFSRPFEDKCALDDYMIDMLDEKGNPIVEKEKDVYLLGKSIEELLVGGDRTWAMQPAYKKKFNKIKQRLPKYHKPVFDILQHADTLHNQKLKADFMVKDELELIAQLYGETDFIAKSSVIRHFLPNLLTEKEKYGRVLIELKSTSSMKYWYSDIDRYQYLVQLAIYKHLLAENGLPVDEVIILFVDTANFGNLKFVSIPELGIGTDLIEAKLRQLHAALNATPIYTLDKYRVREAVDEVDDGMFDLSDLDYGVE